MLKKLFEDGFCRSLVIATAVLIALAWGGVWIFNSVGPYLLRHEPGEKAPAVIAHRGASICAPENTLAAFKKALDLGADGIELDVLFTRDNVPVVVHHRDLSRRYNRPVFIDKMTYEEVKILDAGSWFSDAYKGAKIPTLGAALGFLAGKVKRIYVHDKKENDYSGDKIDRISIFANAIRIAGLKNEVVVMVESGDPSPWRSKAPDIQVLRNWMGRPWQLGRFPLEESFGNGIKNIGIYHSYQQYIFGNLVPRLRGFSLAYIFEYFMFWPNKKLISHYQNMGGEFVVFTINDRNLMQLYINVGIDAIGTDNPSLLRFLLNGETGPFSGPCIS